MFIKNNSENSSRFELVNDESYDVNEDKLDGKAARFVTAWNTKSTDIHQLLAALARKY